ncbi:nucleotide kinase-like protein [Nitzschia inconspicua]|uniref:Adenylate kinase isoenzyme 6 homolog n=1 Tax=Nitzschia inconspicua TaxID=303405 RepID=A0A9K3KU02_9STRA|nr:nucleotide kinase-like protein [Nitzschia inconspicua]
MSEDGPKRQRPNVLITGTPGVGKTSTASLISERVGLEHVNVGELIVQHQCYEGRDEDLETNVLDEDKLLDVMEVILDKAAEDGTGIVADFHMCEIFPERWFDLVLVLRASTDVLFDRLTKRGYNEKKRSENMEAEIMQVILEEARESYAPEIVHEVPSNTLDDMETNAKRVAEWCKHWEKNNA